MNYLPLKQKYFKVNEEVATIYDLLTKFKENISNIKDIQVNAAIQNFIYSYENYYGKFMGLKRFSIPVFGKISSGKSTLLNYILNLHGIFETNYNISTKFICIIRHNPNLENGPKLYNVSVSERGEYIKDNKKIKLWNFEEDGEINGDIKQIIEDRNHALGNLEFKHSNWKKYFMILETNIPLFNDYNHRYSELFEFMDVPGLNEFSVDNDISKQFYYKELIPFFIYNVAFSLFIFDAEKQESEDSLSIINNIMYQYFNNDSNKLKNSIFILNKMDKIVNPNEELVNFKKILNDNLKCHIEKNGFFIGLSALLLYLKRFKYESFYDYLLCIIEEFNNDETISIEEYIIKKMSKDFNINIEENLNIDDEDEEEQNLINNKKILETINNNAIKKGLKGELSIINYNYYNDYFMTYSKKKKETEEELGEQHLNFTSLLSKSFNNTIQEFIDNYKEKNLKNRLMKILGLTEEDLKKSEIKDNSTSTIVNPISLIKSLKDIIDSLSQIEPNERYIKDLSTKYKETLLDIEEKKLRIPLFGEYSSGKSSLLNTLIGYNYNVIPIDTKVCTNIALVVKYTKDKKNISLIHTFLEQTSQNFYFFKPEKESLAEGLKTINLVLNLLNILYSSYADNEAFQENIFIFLKNLKYYDEADRIYCVENLIKILNKEITLESIYDNDLQKIFQNLLVNLNQNNSYRGNNDFFKRAFFILNIPIEAYDLLHIPDDIKESIEIIDFPGLDSVKNIFYSEVLNHLLQFSDGFIFVNKGNSIMEAEKVKNLNKIIQLIIQNKKNEFSFKSCLFILNRCDEVDINIEDSKKEYERIFEINSREKTFNEIIAISNKLKDLDNINITKFSNTLYYQFKSFMNRINDYDNYLNEYEIKIDKKYVGKKYLMFLKKKIYEDVCTISAEKYKVFKNKEVDITNYEKHFKLFLREEENKPIICDIIKMYLFIKDSIYESKFYEKSNAKDFFEKFNNQILVAKLFLENSLKNVVINYFFEINKTFEIINIKTLKGKICLKFKKEDFTKAKENLNKKLKNNKIIFNDLIDSKFQLMIDEYDKLINNFKNKKFKSYEKSIEETTGKINKIKKDLKDSINEKFQNFTEDIIKELNFIGEKLKELEIQESKNSNGINMFESVNDTEQTVFKVIGGILLSPIALTGLLIYCEETRPIGVLLALGGIYGLTMVSTTLIATTGLAGLAAAGAIHLGFSLYKKFTALDKYTKLMEEAKTELKNSCSVIKGEVNKNLETNKNQIESAVKNFEEIFLSKSEGIINHKEEWLSIFNKFKKLALNLKLMN